MYVCGFCVILAPGRWYYRYENDAHVADIVATIANYVKVIWINKKEYSSRGDYNNSLQEGIRAKNLGRTQWSE